jgi:sulfate/thiosulfate transport system permease protein
MSAVEARTLSDGVSRRRFARWALIATALAYIGVLVIAPLFGIVSTVVREGSGHVSETFALADVRHAFFLTGVITIIAVGITTFFGLIVAWVLSRDRFPGRRLLNAMVELPLAVSPVIVGLMCVLLFGTGGWLEPFFSSRGIQVIFAIPSMVIVTIFICVPFVIREVAPVLQELGTTDEEAAQTLGASSIQTFFRVTLPNIKWGLFYGVALSTARALGEIGAVLIVSGALQGQTETATLYILRALEERQETSGFVVALTLAAISILLLVGIETAKRIQEHKETR